MKRRHFLKTVLAGSVMLAGTWSAAEPTRAEEQKKSDLQKRLEEGLRATQEEQLQFVALVVRNVAEKNLPIRLVDASYRYALRKSERYPFPYFERALRELCKKFRIDLERPARTSS